MKDVVKNVPKYGDRDFISHMVQMKGALGCDKVGCDRNLYIPHGSDERGFKWSKSVVIVSFISHMVQMKESFGIKHSTKTTSFISHMVQMKASWDSCCYDFCTDLYIPHGSDESYMLKPRHCWMQPLYIPHGSDESIPQDIMSRTLQSFISHMVQMKGLRRCARSRSE